MSIITFASVSKEFKGQVLFSDVSFSIERGEIIGLVGPNGSGKSVLLQMACGFQRPTTGQVIVDPDFLSAGRTFPESFGVAINGPAFLPNLSAHQNLKTLAEIRGKVGDEEIEKTLARVGLVSTGRMHARKFSLGMRQKLSLAQALLESPRVLVLDEPFNALDASSAARVREILIEERESGTAILFTSHHAEDMTSIPDSVYGFDNSTLHRL